jgi:hypothetical protein
VTRKNKVVIYEGPNPAQIGEIRYWDGKNWVPFPNDTDGKILHTRGVGISPIWEFAGQYTGIWTPNSIGTLAWYDACDAATIIAEPGVSQWNDKSGNDNHMKQTNTSNQPTYDNFNQVIKFDGVDDYMTTDAGFIYDNGEADVYIVARIPPDTFHNILSEGGFNFSAQYTFQNADSDTSAMSMYIVNDSDIVLFDAPALSEANVFDNAKRLYFWRDLFTAIECRVNGGNLDSQSYARVFNLSIKNTSLGAIVLSNNPYGFHQMDIHEIVITNNLTNADRERMEGYLAWRWGFSQDLPSGHTYRNDGSLFGF